MKTDKFKILAVTFFLFAISFPLYAQAEINIGTDLVSRYIWRGIDFGNSPSIQPTLALEIGDFHFGAWGAYQLGRDASSLPADELDLYFAYSAKLGSTTLDFILTDYYFPNAGAKLGNYRNSAGAHTVELGGTISLSTLYLSAFVNVYNDADYSSYFELGYGTTVKDVELSFFVGATPGGDGIYYGTESFNVINIGITASKEIKITDDFSVPIFGSYILNPNQEITHFVLGISI